MKVFVCFSLLVVSCTPQKKITRQPNSGDDGPVTLIKIDLGKVPKHDILRLRYRQNEKASWQAKTVESQTVDLSLPYGNWFFESDVFLNSALVAATSYCKMENAQIQVDGNSDNSLLVPVCFPGGVQVEPSVVRIKPDLQE